MKKDRLSKACRGFTLLELAISMVIIGLLMAGAVSAYTVYYQKEQISSTKNNIDLVNDAIAAFQQENGYLPCPADPAIAGAPASNCNQAAEANGVSLFRTDTGIPDPSNPGNTFWVRVGVVPNTVLDENGRATQLVPGEQSIDGWRNRLTYAVVESMAVDRATFNAAAVSTGAGGAITISDRGGNVLEQTAKYTVLSHGPDGLGAYDINGALRAPCAGGSQDVANCDGDFQFISIGVAGTRSTTGDNNNFDDFVLGDTKSITPTNCPVGQIMTGVNWRTKTVLCATTDQLTCPAGEAIVGITKIGSDFKAQCQSYAMNCPAGKVMIGTKLQGGVVTPKCVKNSTGNCSPGQVQTGYEAITDVDGDGYDDVTGKAAEPRCVNIVTQCPDGQLQAGIDNNMSPICVPRMKNDVCSGNTILIGYNSDGTPNCSNAPACTNGNVVTAIQNGQLVCNQPVQNQSCPDGQVIKSIVNGIPTCGVVDPQKGDILYVKEVSASGYNEINTLIWTTYNQCRAINDPQWGAAAAETFCAGLRDGCLMNAPISSADFSLKVSSPVCQSAICQGKYGMAPNLSYTIGLCDADAYQVNPGCPVNEPLVALSCMYK